MSLMIWDIIDLGETAPKRYKAVSQEISAMPGQIVVRRGVPGEKAAQTEDLMNATWEKRRALRRRN